MIQGVGMAVMNFTQPIRTNGAHPSYLHIRPEHHGMQVKTSDVK